MQPETLPRQVPGHPPFELYLHATVNLYALHFFRRLVGGRERGEVASWSNLVPPPSHLFSQLDSEQDVNYPRNLLLFHLRPGWFTAQTLKEAVVPTEAEFVGSRFARVNASSIKRMYTSSSLSRLDASCRSFQHVREQGERLDQFLVTHPKPPRRETTGSNTSTR
jgi:hypothetical protein